MSSISTVSYSSALDLQRPDPAEMRKKMFQDADTDGSGTVSQDELTAALENAPKGPDGAEEIDSTELFSQIDTDGDGEISETENDTYLEAKDAERANNKPDMAMFAGGTDLVKTLTDLLNELQDEDDDSTTSTDATSSTSSTSTASSTSSTTSTDETDETDTKEALEEAITNLLTELKKQNPMYDITGENTSSATLSLYKSEA